MTQLLLWCVLSVLLGSSWCYHPLKVIHSWKTIDFVYPPYHTRESFIASGRFIPEHNALMDVDVLEDVHGIKKMFVTLPKLSHGIPVTLATVEHDGRLKPYPDWSWHKEGTCNMVSVFRIMIDKCNRLWVLDSGVIDVLTTNPTQVCKPQILLFDLNTDTLIGRYHFPDDVVDKKSLLATIEVDARGEYCEDSFAYIADMHSFRLIVFDANKGSSWKIPSNYFYPDPFHGRFEIQGIQFDLMNGILGLALGPFKDYDRLLYWHNLAGVHEGWVKTSVIRNETLFYKGLNRSPDSFVMSTGVRESQSAAETMSSNGILFFSLLGSNSIACWNSNTPYSPENIFILKRNDEELQFPSGMKIKNGKLYVLSDRFQIQVTGRDDPSELTYRILVGDLDTMTAGTPCQTHEKEYAYVKEIPVTYDTIPGHYQSYEEIPSYEESSEFWRFGKPADTKDQPKADVKPAPVNESKKEQ